MFVRVSGESKPVRNNSAEFEVRIGGSLLFVTVEMKHIVNESIKHQHFIIVTRMPGER